MVVTRPFPVTNYDFLLDCDPVSVGTTYVITRSAGRVIQEAWYNTATTKLMKVINYTRSGGLLTVEEVQVYAADGVTVVAQNTTTYHRSMGLVIGATTTRDV